MSFILIIMGALLGAFHELESTELKWVGNKLERVTKTGAGRFEKVSWAVMAFLSVFFLGLGSLGLLIEFCMVVGALI
jgi:hypothetical protein